MILVANSIIVCTSEDLAGLRRMIQTLAGIPMARCAPGRHFSYLLPPFSTCGFPAAISYVSPLRSAVLELTL